MEAKEILTLNIKEGENARKLEKNFKKTKVYEKMKSNDASELKAVAEKFLKHNDFETFNTMSYTDGVTFKLIDFNGKELLTVRGMSIKEVYMKCVLYVMLKKKRGSKR